MIPDRESFAEFFEQSHLSLAEVRDAFPDTPPVPSVGRMEPKPTPIPAAAEHEPLVQVTDTRMGWHAVWWRNGWPKALPNCYVRASTAKRLSSVAATLEKPWSLAVVDAWRPRRLQEDIFDRWQYRTEYVVPPERRRGLYAPHITGGTVDVTLTYDGTPLLLGDPYMDFYDTPEDTATNEWLRRVLHWRMMDAGFCAHPAWWWQYEFGTSHWATATQCAPLYGAASLF